ncbi:MAG TPA: SDR family NAD(P)-dependent oxidoreductase [Nevskiaceae bacterium]|nr:SDR family NAD(P)-dependent oxidoreductase [Nevskiaceae bacterium]
MRLKGRIAIVVGAGQTPGDTIGIGRATAVAFAREGARVLLADANLTSAEETLQMIVAEGGDASCLRADVTREEDCRAIADTCRERYGRIDLLQYNVGIGAGDSIPTQLEVGNWDRILDTNLRGCFLTAKAVLPMMLEQRSGSIVNVSSIAAVVSLPIVAYKTSKAGLNAFTQSIAVTNAPFGVRANAVMPGLIETPLAIEGFAQATGRPKADIIKERNAAVPLRQTMGSAWDVAWASVFLHSEEARFITGAILPVDGGQSARIG